MLSSGHSTILTPNLMEKLDEKRRISTRLVWAHSLAHPAIALYRRRIFGMGEARNFTFGTQIDL